MHLYEHWIVRRYLANALKTRRFGKPPQSDLDLAVWIDDYGPSLSLPDLERGLATRRRSGSRAHAGFMASWKSWRAQTIGMARAPSPSPSPLQKRVAWLADACCLTPPEACMLGLFARIAYLPIVCALVEAVNDRLGLDMGLTGVSELYPFLDAGCDRSAGSADGRLVQLGLIDVRDAPRLSSLVRKILSLPRLSVRNVGDLLLGKPAAASLGWGDFAHLGEMRDLALADQGARLAAAQTFSFTARPAQERANSPKRSPPVSASRRNFAAKPMMRTPSPIAASASPP